MGNVRHPRHGSLQYWPRKRAKHRLARVRSWPREAKSAKVKPLGFIAYKAGMTHLILTDNRPKSLTKGESIAVASTILECPSLKIAGVAFYQKTMNGWKKVTSFLANPEKNLSRLIPLAKKPPRDFLPPDSFDELRLLVHTTTESIPAGVKKPKLLEVALSGGNKDEKIKYAQAMLGKEISVMEVFDPGNLVDVHGITKGKGFQGTVKRYGIPVRQHKAEKTKRGIATLGSWTPKRVEWTVAQPGRMGYHLRTEYNKQILKIGSKGSEVTPSGGITKYGLVRQPYCLVKGSVMGARKRALLLTPASRPDHRLPAEAPEVTYISLH